MADNVVYRVGFRVTTGKKNTMHMTIEEKVPRHTEYDKSNP